jgi:hypothetical protein
MYGPVRPTEPGSRQLIPGRPGEGEGVEGKMPVPPVPDSRRFAKHLTGIIHSELLEIPGVVSQEMRLVRHDPLTEAGPTTCAEIDVASVSGSRARIVVYPLPPEGTSLTDEEIETRNISPEIDVESLG